jgi:iron complex outermembrane receptor protein
VNYAVAEDTQLAGLALGASVRVTSGSYTSDQNTDRNPGAAYLDASRSYDFGKRAELYSNAAPHLIKVGTR